ncbi:calcium-binding protein [Tropicimonas aquimaris]|uniref:Calcium-binding protein n=1 Tax=Tropicimonas aquimaris TaxID=914152 RepID=A0ABW3IN98_9RHOB
MTAAINTETLAVELKTYLASTMPTSLEGVTGDLWDWLDRNEERLGDWLDNLMEHLGDWVDRKSDTLSDAKADALGDWLDNLEADLEEFIENGLGTLGDLVDDASEGADTDIGPIVGDTDLNTLAAELKTYLASSMPTSLDGVTGDLWDWLDRNEEQLGDWLDNLMDHLGDWVDRKSDTLSDAKADALGDWLDNLEADLEEFIESGLEALDDLIDGTEGDDEIRAGDGDDEVYALSGDDTVLGGKGADRLKGGADNDRLIGGAGRDKLFGGAGDDVMLGGTGKDVYRGGAGDDSFVFKTLNHSSVGKKRDIVHFEEGDEIDLSDIDACVTEGGDQDFDWIGRQGFSGEEGELRMKGGVLRADVDGDGKADFAIEIQGTISLDDLIL